MRRNDGRRDPPPPVRPDNTRVVDGIPAPAQRKQMTETLHKQIYDMRMRDTLPDADTPQRGYYKKVHDKMIEQSIFEDRDVALARAQGIAAMASLESGYGKKAIENNPLGIKEWRRGQGIETDTHEVIKGKRVPMKQEFMKFDSPEQALNYTVRQIERDDRYVGARDAKSIEEFAKGMAKWSTDPNYPQMVVNTSRYGVRRGK